MATFESGVVVSSYRKPPSLVDLTRRSTRSYFALHVEDNYLPLPHQGQCMVSVHVNFQSRRITMTEDRDPMKEKEDRKRMQEAKAAIEAMQTIEVTEKGLECAICLKEFITGTEIAKKMSCGHKYHSGCIEKWLVIHGSCPLCRYEIPFEECKLDNEGDEDGYDGDDGVYLEEEEPEHAGNSYENGVTFNFLLDGRTGLIYQSDSEYTGSDRGDDVAIDMEVDSGEGDMRDE